MSFEAKVFKVLISSPSDVKKERDLSEIIIHRFNSLHGVRHKIILMPVRWETDCYPILGSRPQEMINNQIVKDCDLLIALFWTRLGTPTGKAESGTIEEIEEHLRANKPAMLYFSNTPVAPNLVDQNQLESVQKIKKKFREKGLYNEFSDPSEFEKSFTIHLAKIIFEHSYFQIKSGVAAPEIKEEAPLKKSVLPKLSNESMGLLFHAVNDGGAILHMKFLGGHQIIQTNRHSLYDGADHKKIAKWMAALKELQHHGFLTQTGSQGGNAQYDVTHTGYGAVETLANGQPLEKYFKSDFGNE